MSWCAVRKGEWVKEDEAKKMEEKEQKAKRGRNSIWKKAVERVIKMMAGLSNQLSKAWHFPLCWNLVSFLTSRALSWPDGFPLCHLPPFPLIDYICSAGPPYPGPVITDQISVIIGYSEHHEACSVEVAVIVIVLSNLFITPYEKVRQNCSHCERKLS